MSRSCVKIKRIITFQNLRLHNTFFIDNILKIKLCLYIHYRTYVEKQIKKDNHFIKNNSF